MSKSKLLAAVLTGAAAGAILGVLLAPKSGADTRKQILKSARKSSDAMDSLIEDSKNSWFEAKGKVEKNVGIAADELDDFMRHFINKGQNLWSKAKNKTAKVADEAEETMDTVISNGKKATHNIKENLS
jgi:gas vesicle protein